MGEIVPGAGVDIATALELAGQRFGADHDLAAPLQEVGEVDQAPGRDRIPVLHRRLGQRRGEQLIGQARLPVGEEAVPPAADGLGGAPGRPGRRRQRPLGDDREQEMGAVANLGAGIGLGQANQARSRCTERRGHTILLEHAHHTPTTFVGALRVPPVEAHSHLSSGLKIEHQPRWHGAHFITRLGIRPR